MFNTKTTIPNSRLFKLSFLEGTLKLTYDELNSHSEFRLTKGLSINIRKISFQNEWLTIGIKLDDEKEEKVYLKATLKELLISCSVDTDESYLSRYAYFALHKLMYINDYCNFKRYYWPDFFTSRNGGSKYLTIINDRNGLDITFKPNYSFFVKPGQELIMPTIEPKFNRPLMIFMDKKVVINQQHNGIGFCLADTYLKSCHSNHLPFLIPYSGVLTQKKNAVKTFTSFVTSETNEDISQFSPMQIELYKICVRMGLITAILKPEYECTEEKLAIIKAETLKRFKEMLTLWQDAFPYLIHQPLTHHYFTYGLRNIRKKPRKMDMKPCTFGYEVPKICFLWKDKGEYYELDYRISDCKLTLFFAEREFKIMILKAHYNYFGEYVEYLRTHFEVKDM
ncbi:MAG: hypothetical protein EOO43_19925 [Flavobacterium sp.]|nr:MAG: hypothetical protein EOO43_19925 [Flavobacterium sp.]